MPNWIASFLGADNSDILNEQIVKEQLGKKPSGVICIMGPTASGKSALAVELARTGPYEIISVDSALVYKGMDIGTAKPEPGLLAEIPHHLIDIRDPIDPYSAADFRHDAIRLAGEIMARNRIPILVGGSMLYFKALKEGLAVLPRANEAIRSEIVQFAAEKGWNAVHQRLAEVDPEAALRIHINDPQRLQRALEVFEITGKPMTEWQQEEMVACPFDLLEIAVIPTNRQKLHEAIRARFQQMLAAGLVDEVKQLYDRGDLQAGLPCLKAVGYRQVWSYLAGEVDYETMTEKAIIATRQLAKRQFTWLRSWQGLQQIAAPNASEALKIIDVSSILGG